VVIARRLALPFAGHARRAIPGRSARPIGFSYLVRWRVTRRWPAARDESPEMSRQVFIARACYHCHRFFDAVTTDRLQAIVLQAGELRPLLPVLPLFEEKASWGVRKRRRVGVRERRRAAREVIQKLVTG
jgi:hypothetical protein